MQTNHWHYRHGLTKTPVHTNWIAMRQRCNNPKHASYDRYGGRGIRVCERWNSFDNFLADMGHPPEGMTLERKDNDKGYEPGNCVWASMLDQGRNKANNRWITYRGETMILADWARRFGIDASTLRKQWVRDGTIL